MNKTWIQTQNDLNERRSSVHSAGGEERIKKQHDSGKLSARERIEALFDEGTFVELNDMRLAHATDFGMERKRKAGDGVVTGYGQIHGRVAFVASQDFTISGGSLGEVHAQKICAAMDKAMQVKAPFIFINDSGGARIEEGISSLAGYADIFYRNTLASGMIPQIAVILGPCAGGACYSPAICDYIFMARNNSQMYITGPQVVKSVIGEEITAVELGGSHVHNTVSGVSHFEFDDDLSCLNGVRRLLGYLPQNSGEKPMVVPGKPVDRGVDIPSIVPDDSRKAYDVHEVINSFVDDGSFMEVQAGYAQNIVVGFARMDGRSIGIVANQSMVMAGSLEINSSDKAARFIRFCDCFNIPLLSLVDVPAFMPGSAQEYGGIIRHGAKMLFAFAEAQVPKICLIMRKAYGGAYIAMNSKGIGADVVYSWPIAEIAVMGAAGAVGIIGKKQIDSAADPAAKREELIAEYNDRFMTPYIAAEHGYVDEVILPEETRRKITAAFRMLRTKKQSRPEKKHGNIPL
jgi:propionyl-CoA carboxylase beta chain